MSQLITCIAFLCIVFLINYSIIRKRSFKITGDAASDDKQNAYRWSSIKSKNKIIASYLIIDTDTPLDLEITRKGRSHRVLNFLGFYSEIKTPNVLFNDRYHIQCDNEAFKAKVTTSPALQDALITIFNHDSVRKILARSNILVAQFAKSDMGIPESVKSEISEKLHDIRLLLKQTAINTSENMPDTERSAFPSLVAIYLSIMTSILCGIFLTFFIYIDTNQIINYLPIMVYASKSAIAALLLLLISARITLSNSSYGYSVAKSILTIGVVGLPIVFYSFFYFLNSSMDDAAAQNYSADVLRKATTGSRHPKYHIYVQDWHNRNRVIELDIDRNSYSHINTGQKVYIFIHPGYFGSEWIEPVNFVETRKS